MSMDDRFRINTPQVAHETIDGENVIINLENGNYYSLLGTGAEVWSYIETGATIGDIMEMIDRQYGGTRGEIEKAVEDFVSELKKEGLVVPLNCDKNLNSGLYQIQSETSENGKKPAFEVPVLNKYTDMQDLLLLDPIHEVDETGWPTPKQPSEEE